MGHPVHSDGGGSGGGPRAQPVIRLLKSKPLTALKHEKKMMPGRKVPNNRAKVLRRGGGVSDEVQPKAQV